MGWTSQNGSTFANRLTVECSPPDDGNVPALEGAGTDFQRREGAWWLGFRSSADPGAARDQRGAVAVEFALIMPMLCLLVFGIIEFGFMLNRDMIVGNASRDGARAASLADPYADICKAIKDELSASGIPVPNPATPTNGNCAVDASSKTTIIDHLQEARRDGVLDRLRHRRDLGLHRDRRR